MHFSSESWRHVETNLTQNGRVKNMSVPSAACPPLHLVIYKTLQFTL